jgi:eukaryotic-like serine/threonine-protein kinase
MPARIGAYRVVREIGRGGMSVVYLGERDDGAFEQRVALKLIKPGTDTREVLQRFRQERQILASLHHSAIAQLFDGGSTESGHPYFVMEFVDGQPIDAWCEARNASIRMRLELFVKVCEAVQHAHDRNIVHRDLKPSNIMVSAHGEVKLLDFGIAKALDPDALPHTVPATRVALRPLTPEYASPEQVRGEPVTTASDVYQLGALLYLLLTGRLPYQLAGESTEALARTICDQPSEPPSRHDRRLRGDLDTILLMALRKAPERRYHNAEELAADLRRHLAGEPVAARRDALLYGLGKMLRRHAAVVVSATAVTMAAVAVGLSLVASQHAVPAFYSPTRIAVLPFEDFSPERDQEFLGDGIADTLLRTFAGIEGLSVIARSSAFNYRGRDVATIARDLQVGSVLEGSVQRSGDRLRIVAQLVRTADQSQVWSLSFERPAGDIFAIQDEIAAQVVEALLGADVLGVERPHLPRTSAEAYDLYLQGRELWQRREGATTLQAVSLLEQAVALDPEFAPARSELATALYFAPGTRLEKLPRIEAEIDRALALDPEDAQAHAIRGQLLFVEGRLADSRVALERALALRPNDVNILLWLADSYESVGLLSSAARYTRRAYDLDSMNLLARTRLIKLLLLENPPEAGPLARRTVRLFPESSLAWIWLVSVYQRQGDYEAAVLAAGDALAHVTEPDFFVYSIASGLNELGDFELADRWRARIPDFRPGVGGQYQWLMSRGDPGHMVDLVQEAMAQQGELPFLLMWYGRALVGANRYDEAWSVLNRVFDDGPGLDDPRNLRWSQAEIPVMLAGLARSRGDQARAEELEAAVLPIIEFVALDWPWGANERMFFLDVAMGRYERAAARLRDLSSRIDPVFIHMVEHLEWWRPLGATADGRAFIAEMQQELARQLQQLRTSDVRWLLEPEQWTHHRPL